MMWVKNTEACLCYCVTHKNSSSKHSNFLKSKSKTFCIFRRFARLFSLIDWRNMLKKLLQKVTQTGVERQLVVQIFVPFVMMKTRPIVVFKSWSTVKSLLNYSEPRSAVVLMPLLTSFQNELYTVFQETQVAESSPLPPIFPIQWLIRHTQCIRKNHLCATKSLLRYIKKPSSTHLNNSRNYNF